jgi:hypothetical protein
MRLIKHEMAHLTAFQELCEQEAITEEVCLKFGETFDAAMTDEAWQRLKGALQAMRDDHGDDDDVVKVCRTIEDAAQAEDFTQMKGALAAIVHPSGQVSVSLPSVYAFPDNTQMAIQICSCSPSHSAPSGKPVFACEHTSHRGDGAKC